MKRLLSLFISMLVLGSLQNLFGQNNTETNKENILLSKWQLKSTVLEKTSCKEISTGHFAVDNWLPVDVPTTALSGLVKNGVYPDPRIDMNNYLIPDISDKFNEEHDLAKYSYLPGHVNPWKDPYIFKTKFILPDKEKGKTVWLNFDGINYRAEVWLNGKMIADSTNMAGMFLRFKYNVTNAIQYNDTNFLAVKVYPVDHPGAPGTQLKVFGGTRGPDKDLFQDVTLKISGGWDCALPVRDRNTGIYQEVYLSFTGKVDLLNPYIITDLPLPDTTVANLTISATLQNTSDKKVTGLLKGTIDLLTKIDMGSYTKELPGKMSSITFEKTVDVPANDTVTITLSYKDFPQLTVKNPHLWWPKGYGEQYLHNLALSFSHDGEVSASKNTTFGMRTVTSKLKELNGDYGRIFIVNGQRIFNRGGWIQPDILLDMNKKRIYDEARLMAEANMNVIGCEDMPTPPVDFMDACDKYGIMFWETFYQCWMIVPGTYSAYYPLDHFLAIKCTEDIILRYRNNPSLVAWCAANESLPGPDLYAALKEQLKNLDKTRVFLASTAIWWNWEKLSPYIKDDFPVGTTDNGTPDYTWYPLSFYFDRLNEVTEQMFHNELGVPAIPTLSSLKKSIFNLGKITDNPLFPLDSVWAEHGAWDEDGYAYKAYDNAIKSYYGFHTKNIADYTRIGQIVNNDSYKAMYEAANSRMWDITSGVMIWKLNASSPDILWEIYDWYLNPNAAYYATRKACEPLHIQMNANDFQVSVVNTYTKPFNRVKVRATVYDFNLEQKWQRETEINLGADRYQEVFGVPQLAKITPVYFVRLELADSAGAPLSSNLYWESSSNPIDFSSLSQLPNVKPEITYKIEETKEEYQVRVTVKNTSKQLSFMNRLAIIRNDRNEEILPTFWDDNYLTLFPGEEKTVEGKFAKSDLGHATFSVVLSEY